MRTLVRWDPFAELRSVRRAMVRGPFDSYGPALWQTREGTFPVDLSESETEVVVKAALPGIKPEEVDISVSDGVLSVKGETRSEEKSEGENYYRQEIRYGAFSRSIPLPSKVDHERAGAEFKDGILTVTLPKAEDVRPKQIKIKASGEASNGHKAAEPATAGS